MSIQKLELIGNYNLKKGNIELIPPTIETIMDKVNEIVDIVNELTELTELTESKTDKEILKKENSKVINTALDNIIGSLKSKIPICLKCNKPTKRQQGATTSTLINCVNYPNIYDEENKLIIPKNNNTTKIIWTCLECNNCWTEEV